MSIDFTTVRKSLETESSELDPAVVLVVLTFFVTVTLTFLILVRETPAVGIQSKQQLRVSHLMSS